MRIKLSHFAEQDIAESMEWYKEKQEGLPILFLQKIEETLLVLRNHPKAFAVRHRRKGISLRVASLDKFPFTIIYFIDEPRKLIIIEAVWHTSRSPKIWKERL